MTIKLISTPVEREISVTFTATKADLETLQFIMSMNVTIPATLTQNLEYRERIKNALTQMSDVIRGVLKDVD